jgi:hypothetical protein
MERLMKSGYESMFSYYEKVSPDLNEPLYARSASPALEDSKGTVV